MEKCAVVMRVAPTFMRFGSFEIFLPKDATTKRAGPSHGMEKDMMPGMLEYLVSNFFPEIESTFGGAGQESPATKYQVMFEEITQRTARMVAKWQLYGFCHGVLNTDNMSILGLTIDYGPFGFMEHFDPKFICNHSDEDGRYRYEAQPEICKWNLMKLAEALKPMVDEAATKGFVAENYDRMYKDEYNSLLNEKFGLVDKGQDREAF
jgi:serine/tyrosine/threonine adenylyltransferase